MGFISGEFIFDTYFLFLPKPTEKHMEVRKVIKAQAALLCPFPFGLFCEHLHLVVLLSPGFLFCGAEHAAAAVRHSALGHTDPNGFQGQAFEGSLQHERQ